MEVSASNMAAISVPMPATAGARAKAAARLLFVDNIGLIYAFRRYLNNQGKITRFLAPNAYTAYIIHAP